MRLVSKCIPKRCVFSVFLKLSALSDGSLRSSGSALIGHRTGDGERPTAERAATMSWYDEMVAAGRSKSLTTGNVRCGVMAAVHEVLWSLALETPVNSLQVPSPFHPFCSFLSLFRIFDSLPSCHMPTSCISPPPSFLSSRFLPTNPPHRSSYGSGEAL